VTAKWHPVPYAIEDAPAVADFCHVLGKPDGSIYLIRLWGWARQHLGKERLICGEQDVAAAQVETACRWRGKRGKLFAALLETCWLADEEHEWRVVRWESLIHVEWEGSQKDSEAPDEEEDDLPTDKEERKREQRRRRNRKLRAKKKAKRDSGETPKETLRDAERDASETQARRPETQGETQETQEPLLYARETETQTETNNPSPPVSPHGGPPLPGIDPPPEPPSKAEQAKADREMRIDEMLEAWRETSGIDSAAGLDPKTKAGKDIRRAVGKVLDAGHTPDDVRTLVRFIVSDEWRASKGHHALSTVFRHMEFTRKLGEAEAAGAATKQPKQRTGRWAPAGGTGNGNWHTTTDEELLAMGVDFNEGLK
jgi:hypothetical protein